MQTDHVLLQRQVAASGRHHSELFRKNGQSFARLRIVLAFFVKQRINGKSGEKKQDGVYHGAKHGQETIPADRPKLQKHKGHRIGKITFLVELRGLQVNEDKRNDHIEQYAKKKIQCCKKRQNAQRHLYQKQAA